MINGMINTASSVRLPSESLNSFFLRVPTGSALLRTDRVWIERFEVRYTVIRLLEQSADPIHDPPSESDRNDDEDRNNHNHFQRTDPLVFFPKREPLILNYAH
jgi:hypothetical protein